MLLLSLISFIIFLVVGYEVIFSRGIPILAEQIEVYTSTDFLKNFAFTWNEKISSLNLADLPKFYLYYLVYLFSGVLSFEVIIKIFLISVHPLSFISMYLFLKWIFKNIIEKSRGTKNYYFILLILVICSLIYVFNPWITERSRNLILRYQYALLPLLVLFYIKVLTNESFKNIFKNAFIFSVFFALVETYRFLVKFVIFSLILVIGYLIQQFIEQRKSLSKILVSLKIKHFILLSLVTLLILPFYLPTILHSFYVPPQSVQEFTKEMIQHEKPINVFSLYFTSYAGMQITNPYSQNDISPNLFLIITLSAISSILFIKNVNKKWLIFSFLLSFLIFVLLSIMPPFLVDLLVNFSYLGRILRQSYHNAHILPVIITTLSAFFIISICYHSVIKRQNKIKGAVITLIILLIASLVSSWPLLTGNLNNYWQPSKIPSDFTKSYDLLSSDKDSRIFVFPHYFTYKAIWMNSSSSYPSKPPAGIFDTLSQPLSSFISNNIFFRYYNPMTLCPFRRPLEGYEGIDWDKIYEAIGVRYILTHYDIEWGLNNNIKKIVNKLKENEKISILYSGKYLTILDLNNDAKQVKIKEPILTSYGISIHASLADTVQVYPYNYALQFCNTNDDILLLSFKVSKIILTENLYNFIPLISNNSKIISYNKRNNTKSSRFWVYSNEKLYSFFNYLKIQNIKNWRWDLDCSKGVILTWTKGAILNIPFNVKKTDNYKIFIRYFKNQKGGTIKIKIDDKTIALNTKDQLNKFVWQDLGTFQLKKGKHKITLENVNGFNEVNLFALILENEYYKNQKAIEKLLGSKTIIHLLEAESDLYRGNVKVPDIIFENGSLLGTPKVIKDPELSNGEGLEFYPDHKVWQTIEIVKEGYYRLGLRLKGEFAVKIGNYSFNMSSPLWDTKYTFPFYLKKGKYYLQITPRSDRPLLDVVYLFSVPKDKLNVTLEDLFKVKELPAQIKEYKKINPTLWKVKVKAEKPFMLSFAEAYDPLWEARIYINGKKIKTVKSLPLYAVINGFWIDKTGDLDIVIRYKPQDWFEIGLAISALTFLGCIGYLVYDWRRDGRRATQNHRNYSNF